MKKEPELDDLMKWLSDLTYQWYELGSRLKVKHGALKSIEKMPCSSNEKLIEVLTKWRVSVTSPYTLENLVHCLEDMEEVLCANKIKKDLKKHEVYNKYNSRQDFGYE